ncbi:hypothetical protein EKO04_003985 [Ascochyta lentis]|uniref:DUF3669 domain-containing protein n=1 Tax=Ascochyta lentis TaxID=205686 RepID=A0A8H7MK08_9PLEO|nr:hypothetical protein EKO04_003985 [Ascochyta lentis]
MFNSAASGNSITDLLQGEATAVQLLTTEDLKSETPELILTRMLSIKSTLPPDGTSTPTLTSIGSGQCGTVYALNDTNMVLKLPNTPSKADQFSNDFKCHQAVYDALSQAPRAPRNRIYVPAPKMWIIPESQHFWISNAVSFAVAVKVPDYGLISERIISVTLPVRAGLVDTFAPPLIRSSKIRFLATPQQKDCLVRIYLGRQSNKNEAIPPHSFRLLMAQTLAYMHWSAGVDANDVEFVLGSSPVVCWLPSRREVLAADKESAGVLFSSDLHHRGMSIWLLDFNMCRLFDKDPAGLKKLVRGLWFNDSYYPRPCAVHPKDKALCKAFSECYLQTSAELGEKEMSQAFIKAVEDEGKKRLSSNSLFW